MNCWEFKKCGFEPGGEKAKEQNVVCPAAVDTFLDGKNNGKNGGRCCWMVQGTFCNGTYNGTVSSKIPICIECDFFRKVQDEQGRNFMFMY